MDSIIIQCPHFNDYIIIHKNDFNCRIFRHGVYKSNNKQIDPHLNENECNRLKEYNLIYGCGKPFQLYDNFVVKKCNYI